MKARSSSSPSKVTGSRRDFNGGSETEYAVMIEDAGDNLSTHVPDLPGCTAVGATIDQVTTVITEAITDHLESLRSHGEAVPPPTSRVSSVEVS